MSTALIRYDKKAVVPKSAFKTRDELLKTLRGLRPRHVEEKTEVVVEALREAEAFLDSFEEAAKIARAPLKKAMAAITETADAFTEELLKAVENVKGELKKVLLARETAKRDAELARAAQAAQIEQDRQDKIAKEKAALDKALNKAKTSSQREALLEEAKANIHGVQQEAQEAHENLAPVAQYDKPEGLRAGLHWKAEVVDVVLLAKTRPDLITPKPNLRAINAAVAAGLRECAGLRIFEDVNPVIVG